MYSSKKKINHLFSERELTIMQKADAYGVEILCNEVLARELFDLKFSVDLEKKTIQELLGFYEDCDEAIDTAQMSS